MKVRGFRAVVAILAVILSHGSFAQHFRANSSAEASSPASLLRPYPMDTACRILKSQLSSKTIQELMALTGPGFAARIVARESNRFKGYELAVLVGEHHAKDPQNAKRGEKLAEEFHHFAIEGEGFHAELPRGEAVDPFELAASSANANVGGESIDSHKSLILKALDLGQRPENKVYPLEGSDPDKPLKKRKTPLQDTILSLLFRDEEKDRFTQESQKISDPNERLAYEMKSVPTLVDDKEKKQRWEIEVFGKMIPRDREADTRSMIFSQNLGLVFARSKKAVSPVLAVMGAAHLSGVKHQLILYQGFREIPLSVLPRCLK